MYCSNCKTPVVEIEGKVVKVCTCDAPIIAEMEAKVIQSSNLE
jgi:uncharacterized Zn finger protein (UPF0148 family)